ncbi:MAG: pseudouridine synthase [Aureispira sp.]
MAICIATHIVPKLNEKQRLSDYLCGVLEALPSRKSVKNAIKKGRVYLNGARAYTGDWVEEGQEIKLTEEAPSTHKVFRLPLEILYEDAYLAVVMKPADYLVNGNAFQTIERALPFNLSASSKVDAYPQARAVHRLDRPTSGLLLIAKTASTHQRLGAQFEHKTIQKRYQAIAIGQLPPTGSMNTPVEGKEAYTNYEVLETVSSLKNGFLSLVNLYPQTGRTHQLRQHLASLGCPILGDALYGIEGLILKHKGLFLRAVGLEFIHPITKEVLVFNLPTPNKFTALLAREQRRYERYQDKKA